MNTFRSARWFFLALILNLTALTSLPIVAQSVNVTTWQNDTHRSGDYTHESSLLYNTLTDLNFGQLCSKQLDGQVYAQPLVVRNVTFTGYTQAQTVVYVTTENDTVYAISGASSNVAAPCTILGSVSLSSALSPVQYPVDCSHIGAGDCATIAPAVGVLGTPLIVSGKMYVVAETQNQPLGTAPTAWAHTLFAIDISSLTITSHVTIAPPSGCTFGGTGSFSFQHIQRPALLYATAGTTNYVYVAFSMMDGNAPLPNGMVLAYNTASFATSPLCFSTTPGPGVPLNSGGGGIWQDGAGLAYGSDGTASYIYFNTGNGVFDGTSNYGDSFVKLNPSTLAESDYFTPSDQYYRNCLNTSNQNVDQDFGSGGVLLVPDQKLSNAPYIAITADKEGELWVMGRHAPGEWHAGTCSTSGSCMACTSANGQAPDNRNIQTVQVMTSTHNAVFHNTAAFAQFNVSGTTNNYIYLAAIGGFLTQYPLCNSATAPICGTSVTTKVAFRNGVTPAVSSNSSVSTAADGIVWAIWNDGSVEPVSGTSQIGVLYAFDALTMKQLYSSSQCSTGVDKINVATKFSVPTIANGYVYLGTEGPTGGISGSYNNGMFYIFGGLTRGSC